MKKCNKIHLKNICFIVTFAIGLVEITTLGFIGQIILMIFGGYVGYEFSKKY